MICEDQARKYCCEDISLIENYQEAVADKARTWHCHHRGEILPCGVFSIADLKKFDLYWNRPAPELVFLTASDHHRLHNKADGRAQNMLAKTTFEQRVKAGKNIPREAKVRGGRKMLGKLWWNDGATTTRAFECPGEGFVLGRLPFKKKEGSK